MAQKSVSTQMSRILSEYSDEENKAIVKCVRKATLYCKRILKATSPGRKYPSGWTARTTVKGLLVTGVVYNGKKPQLTHLLEDPHWIRNQYGTYGRTSPGHGQEPHIRAAQEQAEEFYLELITSEM